MRDEERAMKDYLKVLAEEEKKKREIEDKKKQTIT